MGWMSCIGECVGCNLPFSFNPERVPSMRVSRNAKGHWVPDPTGDREPICEGCVHRFNKVRERLGMPLIEILPGAYEAEECL